jgi:acetylornithine deacetylase/succinyl-diaminopimelate desuccinylase-like protein
MQDFTLDDFEQGALDTLTEYARIPCLSPMFDADWSASGHIDNAIELLASWARQRSLADFDVTIHRLEGRTPVLCVTVESTGSTSGTAMLYGHMDKQPPLGEWSEGLHPFVPVRRGDRLYARGVADDGYSTFAALLALETMESNNVPHGRCVVLIEASEESGSPDLEAYLDLLKDHLGEVELMICLDAGGLTYDRLWLTTSLRGIVNVEVTVNVLEQGLHSGSVSGVVPSSFRLLRQLLDRVEDATTGEVLISELHGTIPPAAVRAAKDVAAEFGDVVAERLPFVDGVTPMGASPEERILRATWYPTLSVVGIGGIPEPAMAGNVLRPFTTAILSFRLPPNVDADIAAQAIMTSLKNDTPPSTHVTIMQAANGWSSPPLAEWLRVSLDEASTRAFGRGPGFAGEGGSIPFLASLGRRYPAVQFVTTGVLGPDANAHGIDEMIDLNMAVGVTNSVITVLGAYAKKEG